MDFKGVFFLSQEAKRYTWRCKGQPRYCACASLMPAFPSDAEKRDWPPLRASRKGFTPFTASGTKGFLQEFWL